MDGLIDRLALQKLSSDARFPMALSLQKSAAAWKIVSTPRFHV
jgi:hypothetical protein